MTRADELNVVNKYIEARRNNLVNDIMNTLVDSDDTEVVDKINNNSYRGKKAIRGYYESNKTTIFPFVTHLENTQDDGKHFVHLYLPYFVYADVTFEFDKAFTLIKKIIIEQGK